MNMVLTSGITSWSRHLSIIIVTPSVSNAESCVPITESQWVPVLYLESSTVLAVSYLGYYWMCIYISIHLVMALIRDSIQHCIIDTCCQPLVTHLVVHDTSIATSIALHPHWQIQHLLTSVRSPIGDIASGWVDGTMIQPYMADPVSSIVIINLVADVDQVIYFHLGLPLLSGSRRMASQCARPNWSAWLVSGKVGFVIVRRFGFGKAGTRTWLVQLWCSWSAGEGVKCNVTHAWLCQIFDPVRAWPGYLWSRQGSMAVLNSTWQGHDQVHFGQPGDGSVDFDMARMWLGWLQCGSLLWRGGGRGRGLTGCM